MTSFMYLSKLMENHKQEFDFKKIFNYYFTLRKDNKFVLTNN